MDLQPTLETETIQLRPLREADYEELYAVASDPKIWEQHPNPDRWKPDVFRRFFDGAMASGGAFLIVDRATGRAIGSTRFYDLSHEEDRLFVGYTFYATACWGTGVNPIVKALMLDHAFASVSTVGFHIGAGNIRSQKAIVRLGAMKVGESDVAYFGEPPRLNYLYEIKREDWMRRRGQRPKG